MKFQVLFGFFVVAAVLPSLVAADTLTIRPDGPGDFKQWRHVNCPSGNNEWQCVNEAVPDTSDYLRDARTRSESFTFTDTGLTTETVNSVTIWYYAMRHNNNNNRCFNALVVDNSVSYVAGTQMCVGSSWSYVSHTYTTNPATRQAWTVAEVDALQAGMKSTNPSGGGRVAQVYAVVDYTPTPPPQPDLIIDDMTFVEYMLNTTLMVDVNVKVKNVGTSSASVSFTEVAGLVTQNIFTSSLAPGASTWIFPLTYACTSAHTATATADITSLITESDETNNQGSTFIDCI